MNRQRYTGREDDGTGLMYYRARYYDPAIGRFISEDPAAFTAGVNFYAYCSNSPIDCRDPSGLVDWRGVGKSTIDILGNGAGLVTGGVLTVGGAALIAAPEPTMISKVAGGATFAAGVANLANSGPGLVNAGRNLVRAIQDNPTARANLPTSGTTILADVFFPGNQTAQDLATVADLSLALVSGRVPVGTAQINSFSALSQRTSVGINGLLDAKAVAVPRGMDGLLLQSVDSSASWASKALDVTQMGQLGSLGYDKAVPVGGAAGGGFLLYPNKANTNMMQSVYSK